MGVRLSGVLSGWVCISIECLPVCMRLSSQRFQRECRGDRGWFDPGVSSTPGDISCLGRDFAPSAILGSHVTETIVLHTKWTTLIEKYSFCSQKTFFHLFVWFWYTNYNSLYSVMLLANEKRLVCESLVGKGLFDRILFCTIAWPCWKKSRDK